MSAALDTPDPENQVLMSEILGGLLMHPPLTQDAAQAREQLATAPPFPTSTIGRLPTVVVNVRLPRDFPLSLLAALFARAGRLKWIRRGTDVIRIISARPADTGERKQYEHMR